MNQPKILHRDKCRLIQQRYEEAHIDLDSNDNLSIKFVDSSPGIVFEEMLWLSKLLGTTKIDINKERRTKIWGGGTPDSISETIITCAECKWQPIHEPITSGITLHTTKPGYEIAWVHGATSVEVGDWLKLPLYGFVKAVELTEPDGIFTGLVFEKPRND